MAKKSTGEVIVKKVSPYPISATVNLNETMIEGQIKKLTQFGCLIEVDSLWVKVGQDCELSFRIPATEHRFQEPVRVVKTYDRLKVDSTLESQFNQGEEENEAEDQSSLRSSISSSTSVVDQEENPMGREPAESRSVVRLAELHFLKIGLQQKSWIRAFIVRIKQPPERVR